MGIYTWDGYFEYESKSLEAVTELIERSLKKQKDGILRK